MRHGSIAVLAIFACLRSTSANAGAESDIPDRWVVGDTFPELINYEHQGALDYPDIRGQSVGRCGAHVPTPQETGFLPYVCDPNVILNRSDG